MRLWRTVFISISVCLPSSSAPPRLRPWSQPALPRRPCPCCPAGTCGPWERGPAAWPPGSTSGPRPAQAEATLDPEPRGFVEKRDLQDLQAPGAAALDVAGPCPHGGHRLQTQAGPMAFRFHLLWVILFPLRLRDTRAHSVLRSPEPRFQPVLGLSPRGQQRQHLPSPEEEARSPLCPRHPCAGPVLGAPLTIPGGSLGPPREAGPT